MDGARDIHGIAAAYEVKLRQMADAKDRQIAYLTGRVSDAEHRLHEQEVWQRDAVLNHGVQQTLKVTPTLYDVHRPYDHLGGKLQEAEHCLQESKKRHADEIAHLESELASTQRRASESWLSGPVTAVEYAITEARRRHLSELDQLQAQISEIRRVSDPTAWLSRPVASVEQAFAIKQYAAELSRIEAELQATRVASAYSSPKAVTVPVKPHGSLGRDRPPGTVELPPRLPPGPVTSSSPVPPPPRGASETPASTVLVERRRLFGERSFRLWAEDCATRGGVRFHAMDEANLSRTHVDLRDTDIKVMFEAYCQQMGDSENIDSQTEQHATQVNEFLLRMLDTAYFELGEGGDSLELRLPLSVAPRPKRRDDVDVVEVDCSSPLTKGWIKEKILMPKAAATKPRGAVVPCMRGPAPALKVYPAYTAPPKSKDSKQARSLHQTSRTSSRASSKQTEPTRLSSSRPGSGSRHQRPQSARPTGRPQTASLQVEDRGRAHTQINTATGNDPYFVMGSVASGGHWYESHSQSFQDLVTEGTPTELSADTVDFARQTPRHAVPKKPLARPPAPPPKTVVDDGPRNGPRQRLARPQSARARCTDDTHTSSGHDHFAQRSASQDHGQGPSRGAQGEVQAAERASRRRPRPTSAKALKHKRVYDDMDEPIVYDDPEEPEEWPDRGNFALRPPSSSRARTPSSDGDYSQQHNGGSSHHRTSSRPPSRPSSRPSSASAAEALSLTGGAHHRGPSPRTAAVAAAAQHREATQRVQQQVIFQASPGPPPHHDDYLLPEEEEGPPEVEFIAPASARDYHERAVDVRAGRPAAPPNLGLAQEPRASTPPRKPRHNQAWVEHA